MLNHSISRFSTILLVATVSLVACTKDARPKPAPLVNFQQTLPVNYLWHHDVGNGAAKSQLKLQPVITDNTVYAASTNGTVTAVNATTGRTVWYERYKQLPFSSNLSTSNSSLFIGTSKAQLAKISRKDGKLLWQQSVSSSVIAAPAYANGKVFVKTIDGNLVAIDDSTRKTSWTYQQTVPSLTLRASSNLVINNGSVLTGFANGTLASINLTSGQPNWAKQVTNSTGKTDVERMVDIDATPLIDNGTIYTATYQGQLVAIGMTSGDIIWKHNSSIYNNLALSSDRVYATDATSDVWAFDQNSGEVLWQQKALKNRELSAPAIIGSYLVVGDAQGYLHFLDTEDGHFVARVKVNSSGISAAPMIIDHRIIVLTNDGTLYAYQVGKTNT